ncbi:hypothetical protein PAXRUDRAFT_26807 [Paxillus rubicundulus Ve08.2h10]|uniref:Arrestin C-terminal-like domain-containing protein n=1 Tax=Paxillus rubicundulus Ve08.2h10 TaxID=930991 RepID=A0A0D0DZ49_9AGAM|nr:hypothetical protein PAXRUDRAFT_26807 [Paxillus rubicundulus Ve08.2h10]
MSTVKIALQPPPNVDFVVGYPGIPPGAKDRPQAAVKGAVEVRTGPSGAKAKWVRVELKKIETLPGGGQANSYFDHVGPSPISLWQSSEDYSVLQPQDFPFLIRIPESIPPSIALERGAGIRYELVATVCTLGKKGFFRRRKTTVVSQATTIIIDKHELHSTWPVYSQPESRSVHQEGVHLAVERNRTCYGPGDRVSVMAILKSDTTNPVIVRGFEFTLKESTIFRAGPSATSAKRSGPQVKTATIGEQKVPLNVTLYGGSQHKAELGCVIPNTHTTTSLNAARHIDITYVIIVRAWIGSMQSVMMELPVIVSNWPRNVSEEAVRRIGIAPSLCMSPPSGPAATVPITTTVTRPLTGESQKHNPSNSLSGVNDFSRPLVPPKQSVQYSTAPVGQNGSAKDKLDADELGTLGAGAKISGTIDHPGYGSSNRPSSRGGLGGIQEDPNSSFGDGGGPSGVESRPSFTSSGRRRRPSANAQNRLTITNISEKDAEEGLNPQVPRAARPMTPPSAGRSERQWLSAEDEKKQLYDSAVAKVQKVQGAVVMGNAAQVGESAAATSTPSKHKKLTPWPTAEEEKVRLYDNAQAIAKRTQAFGASPSIHSRSSSEANSSGARDKPSSSSSAAPGLAISAGAALYQHAVFSMSKSSNPNNSTNAGDSSRASAPSPPPSGSTSAPSPRNVPHYPSVEEEKAALSRYYQAKLAVDRSQNTQYASKEGIVGSSSSSAGPASASLDSTYPQPGGSGRTGSSDVPPPFESSGSSSQPQYLNEKERLRRQYEVQDAAALAAQGQAQGQAQTHLHSSPLYTAQTPPYTGPPAVDSGLSEKELLRRRFEEQDAAALAQQGQPPQPPPRSNSTRAPPVPPPAVNGFKPLTAAEEKAQLRAKYEAEERGTMNEMTNGHNRAFSQQSYQHPYAAVASSSDPTSPPPPPLMPRPPVEYIQETQEEDIRRRYYGDQGAGVGLEAPSAFSNPRLDMRPFTPFDAGFGYEGRNSASSPARPRPPPPAAN